MNGLFGWIGPGVEHPAAVLDAMASSTGINTVARVSRAHGLQFGVAAAGAAGTFALAARDGRTLALWGHPLRKSADGRLETIDAVATWFLARFVAKGCAALSELGGDFALALIESDGNRLVLAVDRMSVRNIVYSSTTTGVVFAPTCTALAQHPAIVPTVDPQGIYNYLYFHMVPGPSTVFRGQSRVPAGHYVEAVGGRCVVKPYWTAHFSELARPDFAVLKREFKSTLQNAVTSLTLPAGTGAFLSGGTDSSTLAGMLGIATGSAASTFSIGFAEKGYDETDYARIAARHFNTDQHEYTVVPADVVAAIPLIADAYDQPFGNASAVPTYYCALLARENGVARMLGGDGGDELFGGNSRYAKQQQFARYGWVPEFLRHHLIEPAARRFPAADRIALLRKARSYVNQASMPMPERYDSYNLLERVGASQVFTADFLATVDPSAPMRQMRDVYQAVDAKSVTNRLLALDFQFTLSDNDLPKVTRMCELAEVDVAFPMLHDDVVDFSLRLPTDFKLRGTRLRYFFKRALDDFLPPEIITKEKHGFGLPTGIWLQTVPELRALAADNLAMLRKRGIVRAEFIDLLLDKQLAVHAGYYGTMVWILMMLELWFQRHPAAVR